MCLIWLLRVTPSRSCRGRSVGRSLNAGFGLLDGAVSSSSPYTHTESDVQLPPDGVFRHEESATVYGLRFRLKTLY